MRMRNLDAITWLKEYNVPNEECLHYKFGTGTAEAAERRVTDIIDKPIFLTHFLIEIKAFYMKKDLEDR